MGTSAWSDPPQCGNSLGKGQWSWVIHSRLVPLRPTNLLVWQCNDIFKEVLKLCMPQVWQSTGGKWWLSHWASMLRWIWSISECNLKTSDSLKRTLKSGPCVRERRRSGPAKQKPKHNPCRPVGRNWKVQKWSCDPVAGNHWDPKGIPRRSMENVKWYSSSQVSTANMCRTHSWPQHQVQWPWP